MDHPQTNTPLRNGNAYHGLSSASDWRNFSLRPRRGRDPRIVPCPEDWYEGFRMSFQVKSGKNKAVRILLVDDHPVVRDGFAELINREPDLSVCAAAEDRWGAIQAVEQTAPQLVV